MQLCDMPELEDDDPRREAVQQCPLCETTWTVQRLHPDLPFDDSYWRGERDGDVIECPYCHGANGVLVAGWAAPIEWNDDAYL